MKQFEVGDTVVLKSGGPVMTVVEVSAGATDWIACSWFDGKKFHMEHFPPQALTTADNSNVDIGVA